MLLLIVSTDNTNLSSQRLAAGAAEKRGQGWGVLPVLLPVLEAKSSQID